MALTFQTASGTCPVHAWRRFIPSPPAETEAYLQWCRQASLYFVCGSCGAVGHWEQESKRFRLLDPVETTRVRLLAEDWARVREWLEKTI